MALERGKLVLSKKGKPQIERNGKLFNPAQGELSRSIVARLKELNGAEVEFEWVGGQPKRIRVAGSPFEPEQSGTARGGHSRTGGPGGGRQPQRDAQQSTVSRDFHNPYNFIPAPPRKTNDPNLGDHEPIAQDRFHPDRIAGRIRVEMKAVTPLLVPDPSSYREDDSGHKTFALLLDKDGKPLLPSSGIRGMLRSAYEAVTNSRFGRFPKNDHSKRMACRMEAREGLRLIPARVENGNIHLLTGTSAVGTNGAPSGPQYAAWLPRYSGKDKNTDHAVKYPDGSLPQHGDEVECWVERVRHRNRFEYWKVTKIDRKGANIGKPPESQDRIHGWVCITNANINRKHDERVFFCKGEPPVGPFPITGEMREQWKQLIENYREIHEEDLKRRRRRNQRPDEYLGPDPGRTAWSRHVYAEGDRELQDGTLCYARLKNDLKQVDALFPVMIARELYPVSPWDLLDPSLRPAATLDELSPADRVFGWVMGDSGDRRKGQGNLAAVRGLLRIGPIRCDSPAEQSVQEFPGNGLPLAILAAPKPQQGRFYVAASPKKGEVQEDGLSKANAGYAPNKGLRGRKVYPHHGGLPEGHWENPLEDRTQNPQSPSQEYRRPTKDGQEQRDDQNRSVLGWVKPGARFSFDIHVTNLSTVELGALLFLLELPENHYHRFGGGKPLGFGSVQLSIASCELWTGESLRERYSSWASQGKFVDIARDAIAEFKKAVLSAYGQSNGPRSFEQVSFIDAFYRACKGFDALLPVHYPRVTQEPSPDGESFKWFVANERDGTRFSLPDLARDKGLPILLDVQGSGERQTRRRS